jgi:hypothetical protein
MGHITEASMLSEVSCNTKSRRCPAAGIMKSDHPDLAEEPEKES